MNQFREHPLYREDIDCVLSNAPLSGLQGRRVLVTGATGLIGTMLVDVLLEADRRGADVSVLAVGRNRASAEERFCDAFRNPRFSFVEHDVTRPFASNIAFDAAVSGASLTHPLAYSRHPVAAALTNLEGTRHVLERASESRAKVLFLSSVEIYGDSPDGKPFREGDTGKLDLSTARASYTESKRTCEALCQAFRQECGLDVRIARLCRIFGPTVRLDDSKASSQFLLAAARSEDIVLKSEGLQLFSYLYVADCVSALLFLLDRGEPGVAYNVASGDCDVRLRTFAETAAGCAGTKVVFDIPSDSERRGFSIASTALLDPSRIRELGWTPRYAFGDGVQRTVKMLQASKHS